jgi:hypothetical protein
VLDAGFSPFTWNAAGEFRATEWKNTASSTAETSAWPILPSIAWYGQT